MEFVDSWWLVLVKLGEAKLSRLDIFTPSSVSVVERPDVVPSVLSLVDQVVEDTRVRLAQAHKASPFLTRRLAVREVLLKAGLSRCLADRGAARRRANAVDLADPTLSLSHFVLAFTCSRWRPVGTHVVTAVL